MLEYHYNDIDEHYMVGRGQLLARWKPKKYAAVKTKFSGVQRDRPTAVGPCQDL